MKTKFLFLAALGTLMLASCTNDEFVGENSPNSLAEASDGAIHFGLNLPNMTRAGELTGATAAEKLGGMFVVEGTKGSEATDAPSSDVVFDNYLVGYGYNTAGTTESNTHNWEYVGKEAGIDGRMTAETWTALHNAATDAKAQTIKYWDYSTAQYDFIAWSTGRREAVTGDAVAVAGSKVKVTRINTGNTLASNGFTMSAASAADLLECYYTDINTVLKEKYNKPVTLTFKNMAAKVRVGLYETVPGYSVKDVKFYTTDANPTAPADLGSGSTTTAALFTMSPDVLPQSGSVLVYYPHIGSNNKNLDDYKKASVTVTPGSSTATKQAFGTIPSDQLRNKEANEAAGTVYLGRTITEASFAGDKTDAFYTAVFPNTNGKALTLRVDYTLVSTDGSSEEIHVYGAKAVVPATYTVWQPNYAYTYIFKISDNSNGWTSTVNTDPNGLFPITFDAVVANFTDVNAEQTTVTTVATPSITTYQQGHDHANKDEYSKSQKAGANTTDVKDLYVQVMNNSGATSTLVNDLNTAGKSLLFSVATTGTTISEATVMDALENRTNAYNDVSPVGRNGITLTQNTHISNTETSIVNGVDDQPITKIADVAIVAGQVAKIDIDQLTAGTYAYVYCTTVPTADEKVYHVVSSTVASGSPSNYYEVSLTGSETPLASGTAAAGRVYFVKNLKADETFDSYTFKQTKVGDDVTGLVEAIIPTEKAGSYTAGHFYFDVYNQNNGAYAVKVIKVVD